MKLKVRHLGMSLFEFCICVSIIATLIGFTMSKAWNIMAAAEQVTVSQILNNIRISLVLNVLEQQTSKNSWVTQQKNCLNPMSFLPMPPSNYIGDVDKTPTKDPLGEWYFNKSTCELIYQWRFVYNVNGLKIHPDVSRYFLKKSLPNPQVIPTLTLETKK